MVNNLHKRIKIEPDGRVECWNIDECKLSNRCGMCPACYGWIYDFELEDYKFSTIKKKSYRLWG